MNNKILYAPHAPTAHIDLERIYHNYCVLEKISDQVKASPSDPFYAINNLPRHFGHCGDLNGSFAWPGQMAVIKSDAYGHGHIQVANRLLEKGVTVFATGSVQEASELRVHLQNARNKPIIISLLGFINQEEVDLCLKLGIIPLVHNFAQLEILASVTSTLPVALKFNTGMARLGFNSTELNSLIEWLTQNENIRPVMALSHFHSVDGEDAHQQVKTQATVFAKILTALRTHWPHLAASLGNSAGTLLAQEIKSHIGPHICRPGISLYGGNPYHDTSLAHLGCELLPTMWVSAPIIATRTLAAGEGISYGHTFVAEKDISVAIIACGYADGFSRGLSNRASFCINGKRIPLIGRVAMQMSFADVSGIPIGNNGEKLKDAWLLGGPYLEGFHAEEVAKVWGTITYEVLCMLGFNTRVYTSFSV